MTIELPTNPTPEAAVKAMRDAMQAGAPADTVLLQSQIDWVEDDAPLKLCNKSRRVGISWAEAYRVIRNRKLRRKGPVRRNYNYVSTRQQTAEEFIRYCRMFSEEIFEGTAQYFLGEHNYVDRRGKRRTVAVHTLDLPEGPRIRALTSNPDAIRGLDGDVTPDEFAIGKDKRALWKAINPLRMRGGQVAVISNNRRGSLFAAYVRGCRAVYEALGANPDHPDRSISLDRLRAMAKQLKREPVFSYHQVTLLDAVDEGLVEQVNRCEGTSFTRDEYIDFVLAGVTPDERDEEYMCREGSEHGAVISESIIDGLVHASVPPPIDHDHRRDTIDGTRALIRAYLAKGGPAGYLGGYCVAGFDVGTSDDRTSFFLGEPIGDVVWVRLHLRLRHVKELPEQQAILDVVRERARIANAIGDQTGIGLGLVQYWRTSGVPVQGVTHNPASQHALVLALKRMAEERRVRISTDALLRASLLKVKVVSNPETKTVTYKADRDADGHADDFWALAQMCEAASAGGEAWMA